MIAGSDLPTLRIRTRAFIGETDPQFWTSEIIDMHINDEIMALQREIIDLNQGYLERVQTITPTSATNTLPIGLYVVRGLDVSIGGQWTPLDWIQAGHRFLYQSTTGVTEAIAVRFENRSFILESGYSNATSIRMHYGKLSAPLRTETMVAATSTSFTMGSTAPMINDCFNGQEGLVLAGTGAGQYFIIDDYVGSTQVATVSTWSVNPDTTSSYSLLLCDPLDKFPEIVCAGAAIRALLRRRDTDLTGLISSFYQPGKVAMLASLRKRQVSIPSRVNYYPDLDEMFPFNE